MNDQVRLLQCISSDDERFQTKPLRILCLDGGGYRGLASLLVLKHILRQIEAPTEKKHKYYPHKYFDLICGTSTGGLIALMLGRCGMDVDGAIRMYKDVGSKVFGSDVRVFLKTITHGQRFDTAIFKKVLESSDFGGEMLNTEEEGGSSNQCRVSIPSLDRDHFVNHA
jgi:patatin-like phospholipase/acyl hydrolase